jgi:hypothetical protein
VQRYISSPHHSDDPIFYSEETEVAAQDISILNRSYVTIFLIQHCLLWDSLDVGVFSIIAAEKRMGSGGGRAIFN